MTELIPILLDIVDMVFIVGFFCCFPVFAIGTIIYSTTINLTQNRLAHQKLAQTLGYTQLNQADHILKTWFGGNHQGRNVAITTYGSAYRYYSGDRSRTGVRFTLRIAMEVQTPEIPGLSITRRATKNIPQSFEEAFDGSGGHLSRAAREAMLAFIYKGYPKGLKKDLSVRFTPGIRDLTYQNRAGMADLAPEVLPRASMILLHEYPSAGLSPDRFRTVLDELAAVAQTIETGVIPPILANQMTPPVESKAKNSPWLMIGFFILGVPAISCVCAFIYGYLDSAYR